MKPGDDGENILWQDEGVTKRGWIDWRWIEGTVIDENRRKILFRKF